jgi:hypothetical protein
MNFLSGQDELEARLALISLIMNDIYRGYKVVTNFIEDYIRRDEKTKNKLDRKLIEAVEKDIEATRLLNILIFHRYNKNSVLGYFEFVSSFWQKNYEILRIYWHVDDDENVFQFLVKELRLWKVENKNWLEKFTKLAEKYFVSDDLDILIPSRSKKDLNSGIWLYYVWRERNGPQKLRNRNVGYTEKNYAPDPKPVINREMIAEWALVDDFENLLKIENVVELLKALKEILPIDSVKKIILCEFAEISITLNYENLETFWGLAEATLSHDEMKRALIKHEFYNGAALHNSGDFSPLHFDKLLTMYEKYLTFEENKDLLYSHTSVGYIPLFKALLNGQDYHVDALYNFSRKFIQSRKEVKKLLKHESYFGRKIFLGFTFSSEGKFEKFAKIYEEFFTKSEIDEIILTGNEREGYNYLHHYVRNSNIHLNVLKFLEDNLINFNQTLKQLLSERDVKGETFFSFGKKENKFSQIQEFEVFAKDLFTPDELESLYESNSENSPALKYGSIPAPSCKYIPEIPDSLEKYEEIIRAIRLDKILENWVQNQPEQLKAFIETLDLDVIEKIFLKIKPEQLEKVKNLIDSIGIENIKNLSADSLAKFFEIVNKIDLNELLTKVDENTLNNLSNLVTLFGLENAIGFLSNQNLSELLGG